MKVMSGKFQHKMKRYFHFTEILFREFYQHIINMVAKVSCCSPPQFFFPWVLLEKKLLTLDNLITTLFMSILSLNYYYFGSMSVCVSQVQVMLTLQTLITGTINGTAVSSSVPLSFPPPFSFKLGRQTWNHR